MMDERADGTRLHVPLPIIAKKSSFTRPVTARQGPAMAAAMEVMDMVAMAVGSEERVVAEVTAPATAVTAPAIVVGRVATVAAEGWSGSRSTRTGRAREVCREALTLYRRSDGCQRTPNREARGVLIKRQCLWKFFKSLWMFFNSFSPPEFTHPSLCAHRHISYFRDQEMMLTLPTSPLLRSSPSRAAPRAHIPSMLVVPDVAASMLLSDSAGGALSATADELAGSLFGASLFPWLAMLYWMKHPTVAAPPGVSFGLTFLLAFVFGSIPGAIGAGALYGVSLADADWLHGAAESLLAITNCVVVLGFRDALTREGGEATGDRDARTGRLRTTATALGALSALSAVIVFASGSAEVHTPWLGGVGNLPFVTWSSEPANALSIPTWIIHTSSLVEWLVAMGLAWRYAEAVDQPKWRGVTWGMLPLHTSGIVACTYHLFYNAPAISWCVALQAGMTCVGNTTLAYACLRLALASGWTWQMGVDDARAVFNSLRAGLGDIVGDDGAAAAGAPGDLGVSGTIGEAGAPVPPSFAPSSSGRVATTASALVGWEDLGDAWSKDSDLAFLAKLAGLSGGLAYLVKYVPALVPGAVAQAWAGVPDEAVSALAFAVIFVPTLLNCAKWAQRSKDDAEFVGDF